MAPKESDLRKVVLESGIEVKPIYRPEDIADINYEELIGEPGEYPFTRGIHRYMYRYRPWTMRQYTGFATPRATNERFRFLIDHGQNALNVAFDLPTQMGLDSDDPFAAGEVGRVGMAVDTLRDMEVAFDGIPIDQISVSLTVNAVTPIILAMYLTVAERQGVAPHQIRGTTQNDILKEYIGRGAWIFPVEASMRLIGDTIEYCAREARRYYPVSVCGYHIRESGATPVQEIAYAYAIAKAYIQEVVRRGLYVDDFAGRISFNFNIFGNLWEQVAKFRAARRLWARIMKNEFGADKSDTMEMKMIAGGGGFGLTIEEPENNIIRGAYYALIAALSGTQTSALCCFDEAYTIPTPRAQLLSLRTMQILAYEMGLSDTVDPLGGSYYIEWLTNEMEKRIVAELERVDREWGGIVNAVSQGLVQQEVARQAYEYERKIERGEIIKVGVNMFRSEDEDLVPEVELHEYDEAALQEQLARLAEVKQTRDAAEVASALAEVAAVCAAGRNVMPAMMRAVQVYCTLGEIVGVMKQVYGEFREPLRI
ncbi:MAG: methylmalonyl-CoA mutase family protein [Ardenticatenaceae bacterium]|nr:methylmalonyl-CoA mutase family protein [Ardenticatenaceae bacterium]